MTKVTLVLLAGLGLAAALRRRPAALRHRVLVAAIACAAAMPFAQSLVPVWQLPLLTAGTAFSAQPATLGDDDGAPARGPRAASQPPGRGLKARALASLPLVWAAGAGVSLLLLGIGLVRVARVAARAEPIEDERWTRVARVVAGRLGLARAPVLLRADHPAMLFTWGIRRPKVLLPRDAGAWPAARIALVLNHELAHVRRGDWVAQLLAQAVRCAYWFDPLAWIACRRLRLESERACDDEVLREGVAPEDYAGELVALAALFKSSRRSFLPAPAMARPSDLERRIRAMLNAGLDRSPVRRSSLLLTWVGMLAVAVPLAGVSVTEKTLPVGQPAVALAPASTPATSAEPAGGAAASQARDARRPPAQQPPGSSTIAGIVRDQAGRSIPGVPVVVSDPSTSATTEAVTDHEGRFALPNVASGRYEVRIGKPGFKTLLLELVVKAGETARVDGVLTLGTLSETVVVAPGAGPAGAGPAPRARHAGVPTVEDPCAQSTAGGCVMPPRKLVDAKPVYPARHAQAGVSGTVVVTGVLKPGGKLAELQPEPDADPDFAAAAVHAIRLWEFTPARLNGEPVDVSVTVTVKFQAAK